MDKDTSSLPPLPVWAKYVTKESLPVDLYIIADIIGLDNTIRIMEHFNYLTFNIPKNVSYPYKNNIFWIIMTAQKNQDFISEKSATCAIVISIRL